MADNSMTGKGLWGIRAGRAFDGTEVLSDGALVLIAGGDIVGVEPGRAPAPTGCEVEEFQDATILPGMIDAHVHLCGDSRNGALDRLPDYTEGELDLVIETALRRQLAAGVTTVRDLGDRRWAVLEWRQRVAEGGVGFPSPSIVASGPPITTRAGHCWHMGGEAETLEELVAAVRERAERGVDIVKVMMSGGGATAGTDVLACQYNTQQLRTVVDETHHLGLGVTAHAHALAAVVRSLDAGVDGIEHCSCFTERGFELSDSLLGRMAASGVVVCPTMGVLPSATPSPALVAMRQRTGTTPEGWRAHAARLHHGGVTVVSGADDGISGTKPHGILAHAIAALAAGGVSTTEALASATSMAAYACGLGRRKGRLEAGMDADVTLVAGDAVSDVRALESVLAVYVRGQPAPDIGRTSA